MNVSSPASRHPGPRSSRNAPRDPDTISQDISSSMSSPSYVRLSASMRLDDGEGHDISPSPSHFLLSSRPSAHDRRHSFIMYLGLFVYSPRTAHLEHFLWWSILSSAAGGSDPSAYESARRNTRITTGQLKTWRRGRESDIFLP